MAGKDLWLCNEGPVPRSGAYRVVANGSTSSWEISAKWFPGPGVACVWVSGLVCGCPGINPLERELTHLNGELTHLNRELTHLNGELIHLNGI